MDASCVSQHSAKLKRLLDNILRPDFHTKSDANFNLLLSHISGKDNPEVADALLSLDLFSEWIIQACTFWEENPDVHPTPNVGRFVLELTAIVSKEDARFSQLSAANVYLRLCDTFRVRKLECAPSIKLAYVKLLESFLEHRGGVEWIMATNSWLDVLSYCLSPNSTVYLQKESCNFMYSLLESKVHYDEAFCSVVVKRIVQPLTMNAANRSNEIHEEQLKTRLQPTVRLLITLSEAYLKNEWSNRRYRHMPKLLLKDHRLREVTDNYIKFVTNEELAFDLSHLACLIYFIELCDEAKQHMITEHEAIPTFENVFFLMETMVNKKHSVNVTKLCPILMGYQHLIRTRLMPLTHKAINNDPMSIDIQVVSLQIVPLFDFVERQFNLGWDFTGIDDVRESYVDRCLRQMCQYTLRLAYSFRNMLSTLPCNYQLASRAIQSMMQTRNSYERRTAVIVFQALIYALNDFNANLKADPAQIPSALKEANFYFAFIHTIKYLIENFNITWQDCMESVSVVNAVLDFMALGAWPTKVMIVQDPNLDRHSLVDSPT